MNTKSTSFAQTISKFITQYPNRVLLSMGLLVGFVGAFMTQIESDPDPSKLVTSYEGKDNSNEDFLNKNFGRTDNVIFLLVESENLFSNSNLAYIQKLSSHFEKASWVSKIDSISHTPVPHRSTPKEEELDLDDLKDNAEDDAASDFDAENISKVEAIRTLVEKRPHQFPEGFDATLVRLSESPIKYEPLLKDKILTTDLAKQTKSIIQNSPLLLRKLISEDLTVTVIAFWINEQDLGVERSTSATNEIEYFLKNDPPPNGLTVSLGGLPYMNVVISRTMLRDQATLMPITLLIALFFLYLSFRWIPGVLLPLLTVTMTTIIFMGGLGLFHEPVNILTNILPPMLIIIGLSDSIHLLTRYWEEKRRVQSHAEAVQGALRSMLVACLLTSITTAVGMASLLTAKTELLNRFGVTAAIGVMLAYLLTITVLPASLIKIKNRKNSRPTEKNRQDLIDTFVSKLTTSVIVHPKKTLLGSTLLFGLCIVGASQIQIDHRILEIFKTSDPFYKSTSVMEKKLEGIRSFEIIFQDKENKSLMQQDTIQAIESIRNWAEQQPEVISTSWFEPIVRETLFQISEKEEARQQIISDPATLQALLSITQTQDSAMLGTFLTKNLDAVRLQVRLKDVGSNATLKWAEQLNQVVQQKTQNLPGVKVFFTGDAYTQSQGTKFVIHDLLLSLFTAVVIIFLLLSVIFRSFKLGLVSIPPNLIPLVGTMAYMTIRDIPLNTATVIIFSISIGLAVDGTIHMLARFKEEIQNSNTDEQNSIQALIKATAGTGKAIVISCFTLIVGFCVLTASNFVPIQRFGELIAISTLSCLLGTLVIQPALLRLFCTSKTENPNH